MNLIAIDLYPISINGWITVIPVRCYGEVPVRIKSTKRTL